MKYQFAKPVFAAAIVCTLFTVPSVARPQISDMGCDASNALIKSRGSVIMDIKPGVYRRFVAKRNMCGHGKQAYTFNANVAGIKQCRLFYACSDNRSTGRSEHSNNSNSSSGSGSPSSGSPSGGSGGHTGSTGP
ncbi:MAG: hypothetical protein AB8B94_00885 [Hyphomicrobiales bacterium]